MERQEVEHAAGHGYDLVCPFCGRLRAVGEVHEWLHDLDGVAGSDLVQVIVQIGEQAGAHALVLICSRCQDIGVIEEPITL
jgi:hypothetical protein